MVLKRVWADNDDYKPARLDNVNRWFIGTTVFAVPIGITGGTTAGEQFGVWRATRDYYATFMTMGVADNGPLAGDTTIEYRKDTTSIGTLTINPAGGPRDAQLELRTKIDKNQLVKFDLNALNTGAVRISGGLHVIPGGVIYKAEFGLPVKVLKWGIKGNIRGTHNATDKTEAVLKKGATTLSTLSVTSGSGDFGAQSADLTGTDPEFGATDDLIVDLTSVGLGMRWFSWWALCRAAVID